MSPRIYGWRCTECGRFRGNEMMRRCGRCTDRHNRKLAARRAPGQNAVAKAIRTGVLVRPKSCSECGRTPHYKIQAHHHKGYGPEHVLDVVWLCCPCHRRAHIRETCA